MPIKRRNTHRGTAMLSVAAVIAASLAAAGCERKPGDGASGVSPTAEVRKIDQAPVQPATPTRP